MNPQPPEPPLDRVVNEAVGVFCTFCGSTMSKSGFLGIFGKRLCDNFKCRSKDRRTQNEIRSDKIKSII